MRRQKLNQTGLVSIVVTLIIMIILGLIIMGFARLSRREQRQALDRQLSSQAYYAAETGVNDAVDKIKQEFANPLNTGLDFASATVNYLADCDTFMNDSGLLAASRNQVDGDTVSYTCLFADPDPTTLEYGNVDTANSRVIPITGKSGVTINSLTINWQDKDGGTRVTSSCGAGFPNLPAVGAWDCNTGVMRIDLVPSQGGLNRAGLVDGNSTVYLYPSTSGTNSMSYSSTSGARPGFGNQGIIHRVRCQPAGSTTNPKQCQLTITGLNRNSYVLRLKSIYRPSAVTISGNNGNLEMSGVQAMIDATGKANDVQRRIQARIPLSNLNSPYPEFGIQTVDSICKRFEVAPGSPVHFIPNDALDPNCDVLN